MTRGIPGHSVAAAARALRSGDLTSVALTEASLDRIAEFDGRVNAFVHVDAQGALAQARHADDLFRAGIDHSPMQGVPYALKDIYDAKGMATTCHSRLRLDHIADSDAALAERFRAAGAVLIGKLATFEFALGGPSFDLPFPPSRNPWDLRRTAGGSSSGSGAAIAAGFVPVAAGTCTTGSIRGPAAWCGAVGLKPTFGRVSRRGVFPLAPSLDHCGVLTRTVHDAAVTLGIAAGHDPADPASADVPVSDYLADLDAGVSGLRVGLPLHLFEASPSLTADARRGIDDAVGWLRARGAIVEAVTIPDYALFVACGRVLMTAEAFAIHRKELSEQFDQYGEITARRFSVGAAIGASDYIAARTLRRTLAAAVDEVLSRYDLLLTAISLAPAPFLTQDTAPTVWPLQASTFNVSGHPAISVPVGLDAEGLSLAVQLVGRRFDEATILRGARVIEQASGWERMPLPDLSIAAPPTRAIREDHFR